jgi:hypothetical protein
MISDHLRSRLESAINRHLEWPDSENLTSFIADDVMHEIEQRPAATITVELTLHPEARDGQENAWKVELFGRGQKLLAQTAANPRECLALCTEYLATGKVERTFAVPFDVPTMFRQLRGFS